MGLSSKKTKTKSKETIAPNPAFAPAINDAAGVQRQGYDESLAVARQVQPGLLSATNFYNDTLSGKFLGGNPHIDEIARITSNDVTDRVNSAFNPRFGSGYHAKILARELADNETRLRAGDYAQERAYQDAAGRNLAGIATTATALPALPASAYGDSIGGLLGRYLTSNGQTTTKSSGGLLGSALGSALGGWASGGFALPSDRRLKTDIVKLGEEPDGLGVYQYRYVTDEPGSDLRTGVMADEVAVLRPWALGPERNGFATVDYGAL